jgi:hypothetical protein
MSSAKSTKTTQIREIFVKWSLTTTFHCYPKIFLNTNAAISTIWSIFFISFSFLTFQLLYRGIREFLEHDVVSKTRYFNEKSSRFPTVTICDTNQFSTLEAERLIYSSLKKKNKSEFFTDLNMSILEKSLIQMEYNKNIIKEQIFGLNDEIKKKLGFSLRQIQSCYFNEMECNLKEDFYWFYSYKWGSCYQFNSGKNKRSPLKETKLGGRNYGLGLFIGPLNITNKYPTYHSTGLRIFVHNNSFLSSSADEILVETGKHTSISIRKTITHKTPMPYSQCQDLKNFKSELYDFIKLNYKEYFQKDCFELCLQKIIIEKCSCFFTWLPVYGSTFPPCFSLKQFRCLSAKYNESIDDIETICASQCPLECDHVTYELSMSALTYPNKQFYDSLKYNSSEMSFEKYQQSHLGVDIFFPIKQYVEITEKPKITLVDLVSSLGGALGVFLGLSVFSFIEIFEIIFQILFILCKREEKNVPLLVPMSSPLISFSKEER